MSPAETSLRSLDVAVRQREGVPTTNYSGSLLHPRGRVALELERPSYIADFNLDQVVDAIVAKREDPEFLRAQFLSPLHDDDAIRYRQEIFSDLEDPKLFEAVRSFAEALRTARRHLVQIREMHHRLQQEGWILDAAGIYCAAVIDLVAAFDTLNPQSRGLVGLHRYLDQYVGGSDFQVLHADSRAVKESLASITYSMRIRPGRVDVTRYQGEVDYSAQVMATFERFSQGVVKDYRVKFRGWPGVDRIGAEVLTLVGRLYPDEFSSLESFCQHHLSFIDSLTSQAAQELDFYLSYRNYIDPLAAKGLSFCRPEVSANSKAILARDTFDLALAAKLTETKSTVVTNTIELSGRERIFVVSGPNQGGKTTFARTFGQLHHLAALGCVVPGRQARLSVFDQMFTHFEREEDLVRMSGKLEDDLRRIHEILARATPSSILIMNEIFASTSLNDARFLGIRIMERIIELDLLCVYVTFVDELASMGESVVSVMSTVIPENPAERTYRIVRAPADGLAYALALTKKNGVTYEQILDRIRP